MISRETAKDLTNDCLSRGLRRTILACTKDENLRIRMQHMVNFMSKMHTAHRRKNLKAVFLNAMLFVSKISKLLFGKRPSRLFA